MYSNCGTNYKDNSNSGRRMIIVYSCNLRRFQEENELQKLLGIFCPREGVGVPGSVNTQSQLEVLLIFSL